MAATTASPRRRAAPRVEVGLPVTFARAKGHGQPVSAWTLDVSTGGARVAADRPLRVDETLEFDLVCVDGTHVCGECRVLREHAGRTYGVRFERLAGDAAAEELARLTAA
jgi:hypothetical protein